MKYFDARHLAILMLTMLWQLDAVGQTIVKKSKLLLDDNMVLKLREVTPKSTTDPALLKSGYKIYDGAEISAKLGVDLKKLKRFTLEDVKEVLKGNGKLPLVSPLFFQKNVGQSQSQYQYISRSISYAAAFNPTSFSAIVMKNLNEGEMKGAADAMKGNRLSLSFEGARGEELAGKKPIDTVVNSIIGNKKENWHLQIPSYNYLANENLYPGIKLIYEAKQERLEYMLMLEPGASIKTIKINVEGTNSLSVDSKGNLIMNTSGGPIVQARPRFYDLKPTGQSELKGEFVLLGQKAYGFTVKNHDPHLRMAIDPEIVFTTYFGGTDREGMLGADAGAGDFIGRGFDVKIGSDGDIYVVGMTSSPDFPVTNSSTMNGSTDVFVMRVDPTMPTGQNLVYATFIGGSRGERGRSIEAIADGSAYITGHTDSADFPTSAGVTQAVRERSGGYIAKLSPSGGFLLGTFIGRARDNHPNSIVFDKAVNETAGHIYVAGSTEGGADSDATTGTVQTQFAGQFDGFVVKLNPELTSNEYFTYLGGTGRDVIMDLAVVDGCAFVAGTTSSKNFPTSEFAFQRQHSEGSNANCDGSISHRECADVFVTRLHPSASTLVYSTYMGVPGKEEFARGIAVNNQKQAYVTGASKPLTGTTTDILVAKFEAGGENMLWHKLIPALGMDHGEELVVDQFGMAHVTGTVSIDGLSTGQNASTLNGRSDIFYARLDGDDGEVKFFTYLGGAGEDRGFAVDAVASSVEDFCATIVGSTVSNSIQTINPIQGGESRKGNADLLIFTMCNVSDAGIPEGNFFKTGPDAVRRGDQITYAITVVNGNDVAVPVTVTDNVPPAITVTGVTGTGCTRTGNNITCSFLAQPGGNSIVITGTVPPSANPSNCATSSVSNTATIQVGRNTFRKSKTTSIFCTCGDGHLDPGEECDGTPGCRSNCTLKRCGDGIVDSGEECDDGNSNNSDHCRDCQSVKLSGEKCTPGSSTSCEPGFSCNRAIAFVVECSCWDGCFACIFCDNNCGDAFYETDARCHPN